MNGAVSARALPVEITGADCIEAARANTGFDLAGLLAPEQLCGGLASLQAAALEYAANGVVITNVQGGIVWVNRAFSGMTGYACAESLGRNIRLLKSGKHSRHFYSELWSRVLGGNVWRGTVINSRKDGSLFAQHQTITPLLNSAGQISHFLSIQEEADDRKCTEAALREFERAEAVQIERARVARDMHDELGANLTRIKLLAERLEQDAMNPEKALVHGRTIGATTRRLAESLDEIVWAVDPQKDRLENLGSYLISYAEEFLGMAGLRCRLDIPELLPDVHVPAPIRHLVFLVVKEALNNVVKYADATEVRMMLCLQQGMLIVKVQDDGCGFDVFRARIRGNGLANMRRRIEECGGRFRVESQAGVGTTIQIAVRTGSW